MRRKSAIAVACLTFFMCMTTVTHAKETVTTTRVNTVAKTGWQFSNGNWYYMNPSGVMLSGWQRINGKWYYLGEDGIMQTGWIKLGHDSYYCTTSGAMLSGWQFINGNWYYMNSSGVMLSGWQRINGKWYYLGDSNDGTMRLGWQEINGTTYYFSAGGAMAENGWLLENGIWHHFAYGGARDYTQTTAPTLTYDNGYYVSPMKTGNFNTSAERIEAMIARAYEYLGTPYRICTSSYPGDGVDCSGLVMQALYAAGFDPYPATPSHHAKPENEYDSRTLWAYTPMAHVPTSDLRRGDLVFYSSGPYAPIYHVAIYLGNGKVIEAWPPYVTDTCGVTDWPHPYILGVARPFE